MKTLKDLLVKNQRVLLRLDLNVPLEGEKIIDATRIDATLATINEILKRGGHPILMSHLGSPKGKIDPQYSLKPIRKELEEKLKKKILFADDCVGEKTLQLSKSMKAGEILLLENLRFHEGEEAPDKEPEFVKKLAALGDVYVNDAFATAHRKHSSTFLLPNYFPGKKAIGLLMEKELYYLGKTIKHPNRPFLAMIGGAKINSKIAIIHSLLDHVDELIIGGALSNTFLAVQGYRMGSSLVQLDAKDEVKKIIEKADKKKISIYLPKDLVGINKENQVFERSIEQGLEEGEESRDIGKNTIQFFSQLINRMQTVFWNGPFGMYEDPRFIKGTLALLKELSSFKGQSVIGGGDLVAVAKICSISNFTHISTGGGASLEFIEKGELPALAALEERVTI